MKSQISFAIAILLISAPGFTQSLVVGEKAPGIKLEQMLKGNGKKVVTLENLKGNIIVIDFWTTWCSPCIKAFPHINELVQIFGKDPVVFLTVSNEEEAIVKPLLEKVDLDAWIALDTDLSMFKSYNAWAIPKTVVIDQNGKLVAIVHPKYLGKDLIEDLLSGKQPEKSNYEDNPYHDPEGAERQFRKMGNLATRN